MQPDRALYRFMTPAGMVADLASYFLERTPVLEDVWRREYASSAVASRLLTVTLGNFSYVFDPQKNRLVGAYGIVTARHTTKRDGSRQQGHPRPEIVSDAKGHAIAHSMGGGFDINIFEQDGRLNRAEFRRLERADWRRWRHSNS